MRFDDRRLFVLFLVVFVFGYGFTREFAKSSWRWRVLLSAMLLVFAWEMYELVVHDRCTLGSMLIAAAVGEL